MNLSYGANGTDALVDNVATSIIRINVGNGKRIGGQIIATIWAINGLEIHAITDRFLFSAIAKAGVITTSLSAVETSALAASSGTLTTAWAMTDSTLGYVDVFLTANTSLLNPRVDWHMILNGDASLGVDGILT